MSTLRKFILAVPDPSPDDEDSAPDPPKNPPEASEWPEALETWMRRSAWAVICFPGSAQAEQCAADLEGFLPPGRVTQVEGGATVQFDFRKHQPRN
jgi:hypothetical protein